MKVLSYEHVEGKGWRIEIQKGFWFWKKIIVLLGVKDGKSGGVFSSLKSTERPEYYIDISGNKYAVGLYNSKRSAIYWLCENYWLEKYWAGRKGEEFWTPKTKSKSIPAVF